MSRFSLVWDSSLLIVCLALLSGCANSDNQRGAGDNHAATPLDSISLFGGLSQLDRRPPPYPGTTDPVQLEAWVRAMKAFDHDPLPESSGCIVVELTDADEVHAVNVRFMTAKPSKGTIVSAVQSLDGANELTDDSTLLDLMQEPGFVDVTFSNRLGDALTISATPDVGGITVRLHGKPVESVSFY